MLLHHRDPYSPGLTREIQIGYYGRPLDPSRPDDPKDQQRFAYPVYVVFLMAPTIGLSFPAAQTCFRWLFVLLTLVSVPLWLRAARWRPSLAVTCDPHHSDLWQLRGGAGNQVAAVEPGGKRDHGGVRGSFGAADNLRWRAFCWRWQRSSPNLRCQWRHGLALWAVSDWRRRQGFVWSFAFTMAVLLAGSEYVLPGWISRFRDAVSAYASTRKARARCLKC